LNIFFVTVSFFKVIYGFITSTLSSVGVDTAWTVGVLFPAGARYLSILHSVQTGSMVYATSYPMGTGAPSPGVKRPGRDADHSLSCSAEVKNVVIPPLYNIRIFMAKVNTLNLSL
jgi:hypothetical protein